MNIFILDKDIDKNIKYHCDKHKKMIIEYVQMIQNCFSLEDLQNAPLTKKETYRKHSYWNHPCSVWVRQTRGNLLYLMQLALGLCEEFEYRDSKVHFTKDFILWAIDNIHLAELESYEEELTPFVRAIKKEKYPDLLDEKLFPDVIECYREYYRRDKKSFAKWTKRNKPEWF